MNSPDSPPYLQPYLDAARKYGAGFGTLLWASPQTQAARFSALLRAVDVTGQIVLDVGCGRADLQQFMLRRGLVARQYIGLEAVEELATAAENKRLANCRIIRGDFVRDSSLMNIGADIVLFSGSLNTLDEPAFYRTLANAIAAAKSMVVFNFLSSPFLAASSYLTWHRPEAVRAFAEQWSSDVRQWDDYLKGDTTIAIGKETKQS
jgi:hypothetical protein